MTDDNKKQLKKELTEIQCPECRKISFYGDWKYVDDGDERGIQCPECGAICDED